MCEQTAMVLLPTRLGIDDYNNVDRWLVKPYGHCMAIVPATNEYDLLATFEQVELSNDYRSAGFDMYCSMFGVCYD